MAQTKGTGGLWPKRNAKSDNAPDFSGYIVVPEGVKPGDRLQLSGWMKAEVFVADGEPKKQLGPDTWFSMRGQAESPEQAERREAKLTDQARQRFETAIDDAETPLGLSRIVQDFKGSDSWARLTHAEQITLDERIARRAKALDEAC
jgi:hypothetical protein